MLGDPLSIGDPALGSAAVRKWNPVEICIFSGYGFLNKLLIGIGAVEKPVEFLASRWLLLFVISIVVVWRSVPFMALVCLAGRQSLPEDVYEAAEIDGEQRGKSSFTLPFR